MVNSVGILIAERRLERSSSPRPVLARLGLPRPSRRAPWECPYQIVGGGRAGVRLGLGEEALQALLAACAGLRNELTAIQASWLGTGAPGIPPFLPDFLGNAFTAHLEALVEREVEKFTAKLRRAHERRARRAAATPTPRRTRSTRGTRGTR